jgi:hypothetical protein
MGATAEDSKRREGWSARGLEQEQETAGHQDERSNSESLRRESRDGGAPAGAVAGAADDRLRDQLS